MHFWRARQLKHRIPRRRTLVKLLQVHFHFIFSGLDVVEGTAPAIESGWEWLVGTILEIGNGE